MSEKIIQMEKVSKWFGDFQALKDIDLEVAQKQKIVVCGPSGSGKSTLIRCINRLEEHQKGKIIVDGVELTENTKNIEQIRAEVGMVFQQFNLFPHLSILDNCTLAPIWVKKIPKLKAEELAMNELEKAMVLADKLANIAEEHGNWQQLGNALLFQSKVLTRKELYELSSHKLTTAISYFEQIGDLKRQADAWFAHSWLDHQEKDYPAIKVSLLTSANLAFSAADVPRELDALTYLSILAYKHKQATDKYLYLQQAENKMKAYQLPSYHFAKVPFHYAFFAKTMSDKEPHWKQVIEYTKLTPDHWVAQSSRKQLMRHFIKEKRLVEATALMSDVHTDNAENSYLKALLAQAKQETRQFNHHAQRTFEQARLAGNKELSLDVALLLCSEPNSLINYDFYACCYGSIVERNSWFFWPN